MIQIINDALIAKMFTEAKASPRKRTHHILHKSPEDTVQRFVIALQKGTYVKPHSHRADHKWEILTLLQGALDLLIFDDEANLTQRIRLDAQNPVVEIPAYTWHTLIPITEQTFIMEVKEGPFTPSTPEDFVNWAPNEGEQGVENFIERMTQLAIGKNAKKLNI